MKKLLMLMALVIMVGCNAGDPVYSEDGNYLMVYETPPLIDKEGDDILYRMSSDSAKAYVVDENGVVYIDKRVVLHMKNVDREITAQIVYCDEHGNCDSLKISVTLNDLRKQLEKRKTHGII